MLRNVEALCIACMRRVRVRVPLATKSGKFRMFYGTCGASGRYGRLHADPGYPPPSWPQNEVKKRCNYTLKGVVLRSSTLEVLEFETGVHVCNPSLTTE